MIIEITKETASRAPLSYVPEPVLVAKVIMGDGSVGWFSLYRDEEKWACDGMFTAKGFPVFNNGTGARSTAWLVADDALQADLDDAAARATSW